MMLYKNTKVKVSSPDEDTDFFDIIASMLQGDTLVRYRFINWLDCVLRTSIDLMKENGFTLAKARSRRYTARTIMDADNANDIAFLANTPIQAESLLHSLERVAGGIDLRVNVDKSVYTCFNQWAVSPLKLVDMFTYLESGVLSTKKDIKTWQPSIDYRSYGRRSYQIK